ncbi:Lsr2 family protein [Demequina sp. NBRC 110056]|uniref:histone-like nucleoid-structuring protein Lsr2 n=1 Tax=Demequina sp. NBRC 110056 TaxID=1570345 RepID=UPI000A0647A7|nr:Lsr2 family protein [Demequina sp. NBRC 110056]
MAQKVQVVLVDDIDGGEAKETVSFAVDNVAYEIDLSEANAAKLREDISAWTAKARRVSSTKRGGGRPRRADSAKVRAWAKDNGFDISERGRISTEIREAYAAAN